MNYDREKYDRGKRKIITQPIIFVEGRSNKIFYQQLNELKDKIIENGGNCTQIKEKVESQNNYYGIVDHDYLEHSHEKLFPINFYSVENIALIYINELEDLRLSIRKYVETNKLEAIILHKPCLKIISEEGTKRVTGFNIILTSQKHHEQYVKYINNNIVSGITFMKYKDLKKVVELYVKFYKLKNGEKINHIIDLARHLPAKSIEEIFDETTLNRFTKILQPELLTYA
ncbi:hypothetical protein CN676_12070 [Bacillus wiedmannii]|uniref:hypothetical protein n=1 Tax=Bacillus wiedmannii TaxID=1890302 RepID=UPI000BED44FA|nr:hypothetical protein [Bacillus wiedmannii]PEA78013.1 hypothetical protein CON92_09965 [Bacillus wiedmannii]PEI74255.1 hypothetical protein CN905_21230 [Bacillus wiedmannii]PEJ51275.1 hypothetical protein CN676_12070 [Bacillus wiedmannii]PEL43195.1 hypothetical protein CN607_08780 [Bacillus wiedmannii]PEO63349.1 hypothetical protein CN572_28725 [Bacillus wiedmannii]